MSILNADLHCHSVVSDGTLTPEALAQRAAANGVEVADNLPSQLDFVSTTPSQGSCKGSNNITCELGTIPDGGSATVTIRVIGCRARRTRCICRTGRSRARRSS